MDRAERLQSYLRPIGGQLCALATMESRAEYRSAARPLGLTFVIGSSPRRFVQSAIDVVSTQFAWWSISWGEVSAGFEEGSGRDPRLERPRVGPDSPHDAREFVGEGDGGEEEGRPAPDLKRPRPEIVGFIGRHTGAEGGASAVDEHHPQVAVSALGDSSETSHVSGAVLPGCETEIVGEAAAGGEAVDVSDEGDENWRGLKSAPCKEPTRV